MLKNEQASKRTRKKGYSSFPVIYPNKTYSRPFLQESNLPPPSTIEAETGRSPWNVRDIWTWRRGRSSRAEEKQIGSWRDNKWILRDSYRSMFFLRSFSFRFICWREKFRDDISESSFKKKKLKMQNPPALLLMVQKSHSQPPGMYKNPVKPWDFNYQPLTTTGFLAGFLVAINSIIHLGRVDGYFS